MRNKQIRAKMVLEKDRVRREEQFEELIKEKVMLALRKGWEDGFIDSLMDMETEDVETMMALKRRALTDDFTENQKSLGFGA